MEMTIYITGRELDELIALKDLDGEHINDTYQEYCEKLLKNAIRGKLHSKKKE